MQDKVDDLTTVMKEILEWTGGQPFLTQKLCQFVVEESDRDQPRSIEEIVKRRIIDHWESQDEPEHIKTIRDRILRDDKRAGYLLELYQQILQQKEIPLNDSLEQRELQLSGLVVRHQGKLLVTNPIYQEVFNQKWINEQLASLRPYSENYRAWVASDGQDKSRLLQGKALQDAEEWAADKNLSFQDQEFLAASRNLVIKEENKKAQLERERQDKEAELEREKQAREVAEAANRKAQRRIRIGSIALGITLLGSVISAGWGSMKFQESLKLQNEAKVAIEQKLEAENQLKYVTDHMNVLAKTNTALEKVRKLSLLASELRTKGDITASDKVFKRLGLSTLITNEELTQAFLLAAITEAYRSLGNEEQALEILQELELNALELDESQLDPNILNQVKAFAYFQAGKIREEKYYQNAYNALKDSNFDPFNPNIETDILNEQDVENIHWELIKSRNIDINSSDEIAKDFREHLYAGLESLLKQDRLREADFKTFEVMLYITGQTEERVLSIKSLENFDCKALKEIDNLWYNYPQRPQHFGFRVQKEIWQKNGSPTFDSPIEIWRQFNIDLGWKTEESGTESVEGYVSYDDLGGFTNILTSSEGNLPYLMIPTREIRINGKRVKHPFEENTYNILYTTPASASLFSRCEL